MERTITSQAPQDLVAMERPITARALNTSDLDRGRITDLEASTLEEEEGETFPLGDAHPPGGETLDLAPGTIPQALATPQDFTQQITT